MTSKMIGRFHDRVLVLMLDLPTLRLNDLSGRICLGRKRRNRTRIFGRREVWILQNLYRSFIVGITRGLV